ncbi:MAG: hypothetical protein P4L51_22975 [Puia sp.]|nr:hypothetical protein [Puia sp.]
MKKKIPSNEISVRPKRRQAGKNKQEPVQTREDLSVSNDKQIDEDFAVYPHQPVKEETVHNGSAGAFEGTENMRDDD